jgi:putative copper export protein
MKKIILYASVVIAIISFVNIIKIILLDFKRLTDYGYGYLVVKIILFLIFLGIAYWAKKHNIKYVNKKN